MMVGWIDVFFPGVDDHAFLAVGFSDAAAINGAACLLLGTFLAGPYFLTTKGSRKAVGGKPDTTFATIRRGS